MLDCRYYDLCIFTDDSCNGEPECPKRGHCQFYSPMPDVKALLALADYFSTPCNDIDCRRCPLGKWCEEGWDSGHPITCIECGQMHAADVIREALGVEP